MAKVYSYQRFSSAQQADGDSIRRQTEVARRWCEARRHTLDSSLTLTDRGISGYAGANKTKGKLGAFLAAVEAGTIERGSILLVESLDRLSRENVLSHIDTVRRLIQAGIVVEVISPPYTLSEKTLAEQDHLIFLLAGEASRAHRESKRKAELGAASWEAKRRDIGKRLFTKQMPAWLSWSGEDSKIVAIPEKAKIVERIFKMTIAGSGPQKICTVFESEGVQLISARKSKRKTWYPSYVKKILKNEAVIGVFQPHKGRTGSRREPVGDPIKGYYPQVVKTSTFMRAQEVVSRRRIQGGAAFTERAGTIQNLVPGLAYCKNCGDKVSYSNKGARDNALYGCIGARLSKLKCRWIGFPHKAFEAHLLACLLTKDFSEMNSDSASEEVRSKISVVMRHMSELKVRNSRLIKAIGDGDAPSSLVSQIKENEEREGRLSEELKVLRRQESMGKEISSYRSGLYSMAKRMASKAGRSELREFLSLILTRVDVCFCGNYKSDSQVGQRRDRRYLTVEFNGAGLHDGGGATSKEYSESRLLKMHDEILQGRMPWPDNIVVDVSIDGNGCPSIAMAVNSQKNLMKPTYSINKINSSVARKAAARARQCALIAFCYENPTTDPDLWKAVFSKTRFVRFTREDVEKLGG